ncbi:hypothetical protein [Roseateles amylovorans]|uniref:Uncharacterized protein n=1 Tax=Roseateles amylovorans TaxID=2978473 RepID=A0ABY6AWU0_9BURK|nr:hypothetical protein [Roseateles amylovorans]UXH76783.1 hypothetical protein N4261_17310 [Roseateles amylovorans]
MTKTSEPRESASRAESSRAAPQGESFGPLQRWVDDSPRLSAQRRQIAAAFGPESRSAAVAQLKPPSDPHVFTYEDAEGLVWSRDSDDRWYRPGDKQGEKIYWVEPTVIPTAPREVSGAGDGYRQIWEVGTISFIFSSGHGYRPNHHKANQPPSKDITQLGTMNEVELAILRHIHGAGGIPDEGASGTREITVSGEKVEYRFARFTADKMGIGTYYRPD